MIYTEMKPYFHVIMPLGADNKANLKKEMITKVAENNGYKAHFPEYKKSNVFNLETTIGIFKEAVFLLADLSLERPSCYYELGIAEALGKEIVLFAKTGTDVHQTSFRSSAKFYDDISHFETLLDEVLRNRNEASH